MGADDGDLAGAGFDQDAAELFFPALRGAGGEHEDIQGVHQGGEIFQGLVGEKVDAGLELQGGGGLMKLGGERAVADEQQMDAGIAGGQCGEEIGEAFFGDEAADVRGEEVVSGQWAVVRVVFQCFHQGTAAFGAIERAEERDVHGVGDDLARAGETFLAEHVEGLGAAGYGEVGVAEREAAEIFEGERQILEDVLLGFGDDFCGGKQAVSQAAGVGGNMGPGFFPQVNDVGAEVAEDFGERRIMVQKGLRGAKPGEAHWGDGGLKSRAGGIGMNR